MAAQIVLLATRYVERVDVGLSPEPLIRDLLKTDLPYRDPLAAAIRQLHADLQSEQIITVDPSLIPVGAVLGEDLYSDGCLLLTKGQVIDDSIRSLIYRRAKSIEMNPIRIYKPWGKSSIRPKTESR